MYINMYMPSYAYTYVLRTEVSAKVVEAVAQIVDIEEEKRRGMDKILQMRV